MKNRVRVLMLRSGICMLAGFVTAIVLYGLWFTDDLAHALQRDTGINWPLEWVDCSGIANTVIGIDDDGEPAALFCASGSADSLFDFDRHGRLFLVKKVGEEDPQRTRSNLLQVFQLSMSDDRKRILPKIDRLATFDSAVPDWILVTNENDSIYVVSVCRDSNSSNSDERAITKFSWVDDSPRMKLIWSIDHGNCGDEKCSNIFLPSRENRKRMIQYLPISDQVLFYGDKGKVGVISDRVTGRISCTDIDVRSPFRFFDSLHGMRKIGAIGTESRFPAAGGEIFNDDIENANAWVLHLYDLGKSDGARLVESRMSIRREVDNKSIGNGIVLSDRSCITYHENAVTLWNGNQLQSQQVVRLPKYPSDYSISLVRAVDENEIQVVVADHNSNKAMWCQLRIAENRVKTIKSWKVLPYFEESEIGDKYSASFNN